LGDASPLSSAAEDYERLPPISPFHYGSHGLSPNLILISDDFLPSYKLIKCTSLWSTHKYNAISLLETARCTWSILQNTKGNLSFRVSTVLWRHWDVQWNLIFDGDPQRGWWILENNRSGSYMKQNFFRDHGNWKMAPGKLYLRKRQIEESL
jgi:hypothetical protein